MHLEFEKWHGCNNDFVVAWIQRTDKDLIIPSLQRQAARICSRTGSGIAADGLLILVTRDRRELYPEELIVINSDGSLAKNCGNGLRCAAGSVLRKLQAAGTAPGDMPPAFELPIQGRVFWCKVFDQKVFGAKGFIGVGMGEVEVEAIGPGHRLRAALELALMSPRADQLVFYRVVIGNPHLVLLGMPPDAMRLAAFAEAIQNLDGWDGINVHFAEECAAVKNVSVQVDQSWTVLPWERGVGLTQACGSGAVAVAAAVAAQDAMGESEGWTMIRMPGGDLFIQIAEENHTLAGPAELAFTGALKI